MDQLHPVVQDEIVYAFVSTDDAVVGLIGAPTTEAGGGNGYIFGFVFTLKGNKATTRR